MDINVKLIVDLYKEEVANLVNENILLKAQLVQLKELVNEMNKRDEGEEEHE